MGNTNSQQIATSIATSIATNIIKSLQMSNSNTTIINNLKAACNADVIQEQDVAYNTCIKNMVVNEKMTANDIYTICKPLIGCTVSDVDMSQNIYIESSTTQMADIQQNLENNVKNALSQFKNDKTSQAINAVSNEITKNETDIANLILNNTIAQQVINVNNISIKGVTMSQSIKYFADNLQNIASVQKAVNNLATTITQSSVSTINTAIIVGVIIVSVFIMIFLILLLSKSRDIQEFFYKILPILTWVIIVTIITILHILIKPLYVSYVMPGEKEKHLNITTFLMYMFLYYVATAILVWTFFKIIRRGNQEYSTSGLGDVGGGVEDGGGGVEDTSQSIQYSRKGSSSENVIPEEL